MKGVCVIFLTWVCSLVVSCRSLEEWDVDYYDIHTDSAENDEYPSYSPTFRGHFSDADDFMLPLDETDNDLDENTIPTFHDGPAAARPVVDNTETVPSKENAAVIEKLSSQVDKLMSEVKAQQDKMTELENANNKLQSKVDFLEEQTKTNSLIFFNVNESEKENHRMTLSKVLYVINKVMKVRLGANDISVALRANFASSTNTTQYRPIVVRMAKFVDKMRVMAAVGRLSRTKVTVVVDYSERVAQIRHQLSPYLAKARAEGRRAFLLYDSLVVDDERLTLEQLQAAAAATTAATPADCLGEEHEVEETEVDPSVPDDYSM